MNWIVTGGQVLGPAGMAEGSLAITGDRIADAAAPGAVAVDATGLLVLPGIVDLHGDGFERHLMPRPGVRFATEPALLDVDRTLAANGITTAYHGVTVSWEPGLRSAAAAEDFVAALMRLRPRLFSDTRLHIRWETFALDAEGLVTRLLALDPVPVLAFNDHVTSDVAKKLKAEKLAQLADRTGLTIEGYRAALADTWDRRDAVPAAIARLAAAARARGAPMLAHDETGPDQRAAFRALGARACEFPLTLPTAEAARAAGEPVILGAPNVVRGGSHTGAVDAGHAVRSGLCTVLASDYHYPSPLAAAFRLAPDLGLPAAWALVSANPAAALGLSDRGTLAPGARADVILVDPAGPEVVATFAAGRRAFARDPRPRVAPCPLSLQTAGAAIK